MKKFENVLICTDLDGTLLKNDKSISKENLDAISYFKSEGGFFTFITGRMPYLVTDVYEKTDPNCPFGCINGGGIFDHRNQKYLWTETLPDTAIELVRYADNNISDIGIQINAFDRLYFSKENSAMKLFRKHTGYPNNVKSYDSITEPIAKVVFGDLNENNIDKLIALLSIHPLAKNFDFTRSDKMLYEILPKGISKGSVIERLTKILGIPSQNTIALGDYDNDVSMLKAAKIGIAVSNATDTAKNAADIITVSNEDNAIAKTVYDLEKGTLKL